MAELFRRIDHFIIRYWLPCGMLVLMTGFFWTDSRSSYRDAVYLMLLFPGLLGALYLPRLWPHLRGNPVLLVALAYLAWMCASTAWLTPGDAVKYLKTSFYILVFLVAVGILLPLREHTLCRLLAVSVLVAGLACLVYLWLDYQAGVMHAFYRFEGRGALENPLITGNLLGLYIVMACWLALQRSGADRALALLGIAPLGVAVLMTGSRSPLFALAAAAVAACLLLGRVRVRREHIPLLLVPLALLLILAGEPLLERGLSYRPELWMAGLRQALESPWSGHGLGSELQILTRDGHLFFDTHNMPIAVFYYGGLPGLLLYGSLFATAAVVCWRHREQPLARLALLLLVYAQASLMFDGGGLFRRPAEIWLQLWLPLALAVRVARLAGPTPQGARSPAGQTGAHGTPSISPTHTGTP